MSEMYRKFIETLPADYHDIEIRVNTGDLVIQPVKPLPGKTPEKIIEELEEFTREANMLFLPNHPKNGSYLISPVPAHADYLAEYLAGYWTEHYSIKVVIRRP